MGSRPLKTTGSHTRNKSLKTFDPAPPSPEKQRMKSQIDELRTLWEEKAIPNTHKKKFLDLAKRLDPSTLNSILTKEIEDMKADTAPICTLVNAINAREATLNLIENFN